MAGRVAKKETILAHSGTRKGNSKELGCFKMRISNTYVSMNQGDEIRIRGGFGEKNKIDVTLSMNEDGVTLVSGKLPLSCFLYTRYMVPRRTIYNGCMHSPTKVIILLITLHSSMVNF